MHSSPLLQEAMTHVLVQPEKSLFHCFAPDQSIAASMPRYGCLHNVPLLQYTIGKGLAVERFFSA